MARKRRGPVKYTGPLSQPIYVPVELVYDFSSGLLAALQGVPDKQGAQRRGRKQFKAKLPLLFKFYGIDPRAKNRWRLLCIGLALAHVPGMRVIYGEPPRAGAPKTWQAGQGDKLVNQVDAIRNATGKSIRETIATLKDDPKNKKDWGRHTRQNLETRYREARKRREAQQELLQRMYGERGVRFERTRYGLVSGTRSLGADSDC